MSQEIPGLVATMNKRKSRLEPTDDDLARGIAFSRWLRMECERAGVTVSALSKMTGISSGYLYVLANEGLKSVDGMMIYKRPSEDVIRTIAENLGISPKGGLRAAGFATEPIPGVPLARVEGVEKLIGLTDEQYQGLLPLLRTMTTAKG